MSPGCHVWVRSGQRAALCASPRSPPLLRRSRPRPRPQVNLPHVLRHLRSRSPALVSGCAKEARSGLYDRFVAALRQHRPELLARVEAAEAAARKRAEVRCVAGCGHQDWGGAACCARLLLASAPASTAVLRPFTALQEQNKLAGLFKDPEAAPAAANGAADGAAPEANGSAAAAGGGGSAPAPAAGGFSFGFNL